MAETLLAVLLVNSSAKGANLVFRWPPSPTASTRLSRALPPSTDRHGRTQLDNPWKSTTDEYADIDSKFQQDDDQDTYQWKRPDALRDRSTSFSHMSHTTSRRNSPATRRYEDVQDYPVNDQKYDDIFNYSSEFLAGMLCPPPSLCHAKFELLVDDLAFIGHPVCTESDGVWRFKPEKPAPNARGRGSRNRQTSLNKDAPGENGEADAQWLRAFHFVIVLDLPDPSSSASGNVAQYFDILYEHIVFPITAVLFQEQVTANFIETECDILGALKDSYHPRKEPFAEYVSRCAKASSLAAALKSLYDALKSSSMAYITIHDLPLEVQLPPYIDMLLHSEDDQMADFFINGPDDEDEHEQTWGPEMSVGWRLPALTPWKSLLLLDNPNFDHYTGLRGSHVSAVDRPIAEGLIKLLEGASVTLSLADMASLLYWDLESQMFPTVRWLVQHRRAKVVDLIHPGLKTVFTLPPKFDLPMSALSEAFNEAFKNADVPCLAQILSAISTSTSRHGDSHFFAAVVHSKDLIPIYHDIVLWMLQRDMLITLHLRVRIVATVAIKQRAHALREQAIAARLRLGRHTSTEPAGSREIKQGEFGGGTGSISWVSMSPRRARLASRQVGSASVTIASPVLEEDETAEQETDSDDDDDDDPVESDTGDLFEEDEEDSEQNRAVSSIIPNPAQATALQRRWLAAMSEGRNDIIVKRFEQINQYFDGRKTDDEILYRAEITRYVFYALAFFLSSQCKYHLEEENSEKFFTTMRTTSKRFCIRHDMCVTLQEIIVAVLPAITVMSSSGLCHIFQILVLYVFFPQAERKNAVGPGLR